MKRKIVKPLIIILSILVLAIAITSVVICLCLKLEQKQALIDLAIAIGSEVFLSVLAFALHIMRVNFIRISEAREYDYKREYNDKKIRLSFAYLIRIRVNNKYLLVKSGHKRELYGPVGGVYHIDHSDYVYNKLGFSRDETPGDPNDVRGKIQGKNIKKFLKWFNKKENREITPYREFEEELIKTAVVPDNLFAGVNFEFIKTYYRGIAYDPYYKIDELCRFDIYELVINDEQTKYFVSNKLNKSLKLVTREEIETGGITKDNDKRTIGDQTIYILED